MPLVKTITLADNINDAHSEFDSALQNDWILIVVFNDQQDARDFVEIADASAGSPDEPYRVIWAKTPAHIRSDIENLEDGADVTNGMGDIRGFSVSYQGRVCDVVRMDEPVPDHARMELAWANAEVG